LEAVKKVAKTCPSY